MRHRILSLNTYPELNALGMFLMVIILDLILPTADVSAQVPNYCGFTSNQTSSGDSITFRPVLSGPEATPVVTSHFKVHYTLQGTDASTTVWADSVSVYAEHARSVLSTSGWMMPPSDGGFGGDNLYVIYIMDKPGGNWGLTQADSIFGNRSGRGIGTQSFISIHRDSIERPFPKFIQLRAAVAHEYTHACQLAFREVRGREANTDSQGWFMEASATCMERYVWPGDTTFGFRFTTGRDPLHIPDLRVDCALDQYPYAGFLWPRFLIEYYGTTAHLDLWSRIRSASNWRTLDITDSFLRETYGDSLEGALSQYGIWRFFTGSRADAYHFSIGSLLPTSYVRARRSAYPARGEAYPQDLYPATKGGVSYVVFRSGSGSMPITFDAEGTYHWSVTAVGCRSGNPPTESVMTLDPENKGTISVDWSGKDSVALVSVATAWNTDDGRNYTFTTELISSPVTINLSNA